MTAARHSGEHPTPPPTPRLSGDFASPDVNDQRRARLFPIEGGDQVMLTPSGYLRGRPTVRLNCAPELPRVGVTAVLSACRRCAPPPFLVTLVGAECIRQPLEPVLHAGHEAGYTWALEMVGEHWPEWLHLLDYLVIRPRGATLTEPLNLRLLRYEIFGLLGRRHHPKVSVAIPVADGVDLMTADLVRDALNGAVPLVLTVGDDGDSPAQVNGSLRWAASEVIARGWHDVAVAPRLDLLIGGDRASR